MFGLGMNRLKSMSSGLIPGSFPIAIDFGCAGLKVLQLASGDPPTLIAAAFEPTPEDLMDDHTKRLAWQIERLPGLIKNSGFKGKRAVCAIPSSLAYCKHMQLPGGDAREVADQVAQTLAMQLGCAPEALLCRHVEVGPAATGGGKTEFIGFASGRGVIERLMGAIRAARLEPVGMHPEAVAVVRAFDHATRRTGDAEVTSLYLDMGAGHTSVMIAHGTRLVFCKPIAMGGHQLDTLVARQLKVHLEEAHRQRLECTALTPEARALAERTAAEARAVNSAAKASAPASPSVPSKDGDGLAMFRLAAAAAARAGVPAGSAAAAPVAGAPEGAVATEERRSGGGMMPQGHAMVDRLVGVPIGPSIDLHEPLDAITDEVNMCVRYHDALFSGRRLSRTIFVGGEARHRALCQHVARVMRVPASVADPMARLARTGSEPVKNFDLSQPQPGWAVAVGLCLCPTDL
jgi:type IV pilus assembly protein PilM